MDNWATSVYKSITTDKGEEIPWKSLVYIKYKSGDEITAMIHDIKEKELILFIIIKEEDGILESEYCKIGIEEIVEMHQIELEEIYEKEKIYSHARSLGIKTNHNKSIE